LWQFLNQTANAICNYVNRSGASVDMAALGQSYALAVATSCTIAISASKLIKAFPRLQAFSLFVPYFAVLSASSANLMLTRMEEWRHGVPVFDEQGNQVSVLK
jgi:hypothetical protein